MEVLGATNFNTIANSVFPNQGLTENRVQTLKSLTELLLNELRLLESLHPRKGELLIDSQISLSDEVEKFEIELIRAALAKAKGSQRVAARMLKTKTSTLCAKIKRFGIEPQGVTFVSIPESAEDNFMSEPAFS